MHSSPKGLCVWALAPPLSFRSTHPTIRSIALPKSLIGTASSTDPKANQWSFSQTLSMTLLSIKLLSQKAENNPRQLPLAPVGQPVNRQSCSFLNIFQLFLFSSTSVAITPAREPVWFTWNAAMVSHPFLPISNSFLTVGQMDFWSQSWYLLLVPFQSPIMYWWSWEHDLVHFYIIHNLFLRLCCGFISWLWVLLFFFN